MQIVTIAEQRDAQLAQALKREAAELETERLRQFEDMNRRAQLEAERCSTRKERTNGE